jgi:hypothetical protein
MFGKIQRLYLPLLLGSETPYRIASVSAQGAKTSRITVAVIIVFTVTFCQGKQGFNQKSFCCTNKEVSLKEGLLFLYQNFVLKN